MSANTTADRGGAQARGDGSNHDWSEGLEEWQDELRAADEWLRRFASERPLVALGAALAVGYLAGRIISRS